jgi:hypothetical protein
MGGHGGFVLDRTAAGELASILRRGGCGVCGEIATFGCRRLKKKYESIWGSDVGDGGADI